MKTFFRVLFVVFSAGWLATLKAQPVNAPIFPLDEVKPGLKGEVWTVFQGTQVEPFTVEVAGVVRNALGPGKSMILCQLTDSRVQKMGAVAGMSGSPLYIDGKLVGALSYQIQRFETVRYAGFTPAADLVEVEAKVTSQPGFVSTHPPADNAPYKAMQPAFTLTGLSPAVAELFAPQFAALGVNSTALGGSLGSGSPSSFSSAPLQAGSAVAVALAIGDVTLAGTGTVSRIDGNHVTAFGHPLMSLGDVELPMCAAEIITILPSNLTSVKVANTGPIIGTIVQDRLSAISGMLGPGPAMIPVEVVVSPNSEHPRTLRFSVVRQSQLTPALVASGVAQAILGSNDAGLTGGFRLSSDVAFPAGQALATRTLYSGPQAFAQGVGEFTQRLTANLQNPYEKTFPDHVRFTIEPLEQNPTAVLDSFQLSRTSAHIGEKVDATLSWRDWQGEAHRNHVSFTVDASWVGKNLDVVLTSGRMLDDLSGRSRSIPVAQLRSFDAYLSAIRDDRRTDGLYLAVVEKSPIFTDQNSPTLEMPGSFERIARTADEARYQKSDALVPLWETHLLPGKLLPARISRSFQAVE